MQVNACRDSVFITMPYATPHMNVRRVWHILVKFTGPFVSPDATVVPVNMTIHIKGCISCEHHLPEKKIVIVINFIRHLFPHWVWAERIL
jgi:hypothetical protein